MPRGTPRRCSALDARPHRRRDDEREEEQRDRIAAASRARARARRREPTTTVDDEGPESGLPHPYVLATRRKHKNRRQKDDGPHAAPRGADLLGIARGTRSFSRGPCARGLTLGRGLARLLRRRLPVMLVAPPLIALGALGAGLSVWRWERTRRRPDAPRAVRRPRHAAPASGRIRLARVATIEVEQACWAGVLGYGTLSAGDLESRSCRSRAAPVARARRAAPVEDAVPLSFRALCRTPVRVRALANLAAYACRRARRPRRARAQPQGRHRPAAAEHARLHHRTLRLRASPPSPSTRSTPRGSAATSSRCPRTPGSSSR